jgi:AraC-like DNA-binding protein
MCITEKYLCLVVKSTSGKTPREWIDRAAVNNAKVLLKHTDMQISQISDRMNFPRSSAFCKYFKRKTGLTPQEYRDQ